MAREVNIIRLMRGIYYLGAVSCRDVISMVRRQGDCEKHVRVDPVKLAKAKRLLGATTDREALDRSLALVVSEGEIDETLRGIGGKGSLKKVFR
jgi:hypothetical protein